MNWLDTIKTIAPVVASALGTPLAGAAIAAIGGVFGISDPTQDKIKAAIENGQMTGAQISGLRELEMKLKAEESERGFKFAQLENMNVSDARKMKVDTGTVFPEVLSTFITLGFFGVLGWMLYDKTALESQPLLIMLGTLGAAFVAVINYWLGNNKGSDRTKELLANSTPNAK